MNGWIIFCSVVSLLLFVLPFKMPRPEYQSLRRPRSLLGVFLREARWTRGARLRVNLLRLGFVLCLLVVFLPPMMLVQIQQLSLQGGLGLRMAILIESIALILGCVLSVLAIVISDMVISFKAPLRRSTTTPIAWLIPIYEISFAIGALIAAIVA